MILLLAGSQALAIPTCSTSAEVHRSEERVGFFKNTAWLYLRLYKVGMSKGDGDRCGMHPSCSTYTWQAVQQEGPVLGGWLGAARMMSDHRDGDLPLCVEGDKLLRVDRPAEGVFWRRSR